MQKKEEGMERGGCSGVFLKLRTASMYQISFLDVLQSVLFKSLKVCLPTHFVSALMKLVNLCEEICSLEPDYRDCETVGDRQVNVIDSHYASRWSTRVE